MKRAIASAFLSTIVFPGIGQIYNKQPIKGIVLILLGILSLGFIIQAIIKSLLKTLPDPEKISLTPELISSLTEKVLNENQDLILYTFVIFGVIWIFGIIDAYRFGKKIDKSM
jgi:arabinogalactan oligomer/maltooligosaccharide transport system permease protein